MSRPRKHTVPNVGDAILLDCGFGCHEHWQHCALLSWGFSSRLFDTGYNIYAQVKEPSGSVFCTTLIEVPYATN
jgi:hypothetical protein